MKKTLPAVLLAIATLHLVGCKGGDEEASTTPPTSAATGATPAPVKGGAAPQGMKESDLSMPESGGSRDFGTKGGG